MILVTALSLADGRLYEAATALRAGPVRTFFTVTLPGVKYGLISALFVVFTLVITDFGVPKVIGGQYNMLATDIYKQVIGQQNFQMGAVVSVVLLAPALLAFAVDRIVQRKQVALLSARAVPYEPSQRPLRDGCLFACCALEAGTDLQGGHLAGSPRFCVGAVVNPGAPDLPAEVARMEQKLEAGAAFFQTQAVYDPAAFERFAVLAAHLKVPVLAGIILLKSAKMAAWMNDKVPGVHIPAALVDEIAGATDARRASVDIATRVIADIRGMCQGVHLMALGWEDLLPAVAGRLRAA